MRDAASTLLLALALAAPDVALASQGPGVGAGTAGPVLQAVACLVALLPLGAVALRAAGRRRR